MTQSHSHYNGPTWTCDCGTTEPNWRSKCLACGTHVTEREVEQ
jgi:hypothetical protein